VNGISTTNQNSLLWAWLLLLAINHRQQPIVANRVMIVTNSKFGLKVASSFLQTLKILTAAFLFQDSVRPLTSCLLQVQINHICRNWSSNAIKTRSNSFLMSKVKESITQLTYCQKPSSSDRSCPTTPLRFRPLKSEIRWTSQLSYIRLILTSNISKKRRSLNELTKSTQVSQDLLENHFSFPLESQVESSGPVSDNKTSASSKWMQ